MEADEYAGNFDPYVAAVILLLNAEWDHPDVFADEDAVFDAFASWIRRAAGATLLANTNDRGVRAVIDRLAGWSGGVVEVPADLASSVEVGLPGPANSDNARAVLAAGKALKVSGKKIRESLAGYRGVGRRMEVKGEVAGVTVIDDYGHHPTAIARTIEAVRELYPGRRLWAAYEPLTFHRTAAMLNQFAEALSSADTVAIADIWAGRDTDTTVTSSAALADAVNRLGRTEATAPGSVEATADWLGGELQPGDVVLVMGGGRSYVIAQRLVELLKTR